MHQNNKGKVRSVDGRRIHGEKMLRRTKRKKDLKTKKYDRKRKKRTEWKKKKKKKGRRWGKKIHSNGSTYKGKEKKKDEGNPNIQRGTKNNPRKRHEKHHQVVTTTVSKKKLPREGKNLKGLAKGAGKGITEGLKRTEKTTINRPRN